MSEAPAPEPAPVAPAHPVPPPTRRRRLWRWFKKWTRRAVLLALVLLAVFSVWYPIHRALAYRAGDRAVAEVRAELDATDPGWRLEDIEAKYAASLPPPDQNSFRFVAQVPDRAPAPPEDYFERERLGHLLREFEQGEFTEHVNRHPPPEVREYLRAARGACPAEHPAVAALVAAEPGGAPFVRAADRLADDWQALTRSSRAAKRLALGGQYAALVGDHAAAVRYARAALGCARALGDMPRTRAESARAACGEQAVCVVRRVLSWGVPKVELAQLQSELLAEAERDALAAQLRGDRAALDRDEHPSNARNELSRRFFLRGWTRDPHPSERLFMYAVRPYKERGRAYGIRTATDLLGRASLPMHERPVAFRECENETRNTMLAWNNPFHHWWASEFNTHAWETVRQACSVRAHLRTAAVALACERYRSERGHWPKALADLVPAHVAAVPTDPWDGKPLRYLHRTEGAIVYSVGSNKLDNSGMLEMGSLNEQFDICFLLWNPELRGLPPEEPEPPVPDLP